MATRPVKFSILNLTVQGGRGQGGGCASVVGGVSNSKGAKKKQTKKKKALSQILINDRE